MANPYKFKPTYDFSDFSGVQPNAPLPGIQVDAQLDDIALASSEAVDALADIRNPDGSLKDGIVTKDSLSVDLKGQLAAAVSGVTGVATAARDQAAASAQQAVAARDEALSYSSNLEAIDRAIAVGDYVQDYGSITEPADTFIDDGLITDPAD